MFNIYGIGGDGSLEMFPEKVDFDIVKVEFNEKKYITLENLSECTFYIELILKPVSEE